MIEKTHFRINLFFQAAVICFLFTSCKKESDYYWQQFNDGFFDLPVVSLAVDPASKAIYAVCSDEYHMIPKYFNSIYLSTDNGGNWTAADNSLSGKLNSMARCGNYTFAGTFGDGIFMSDNNGGSWTAVNNGLSGDGLYISSIAVTGSYIFAATNSGVFLSSDNGSNWTASTTGLPVPYKSNFFGRWQLLQEPTSLATIGSNIFVGINGKGVFLTTNNGNSWKEVNTGLSGSGLYVSSMAVSGTNILIGTSGGVFLSVDNGSNWNSVNSSSLSQSPTVVKKIVANGNNIFALKAYNVLYGGGIYLSTDQGKSWKTVSRGLSGSLNSIAISGNNIYAGTQSGVYISDNNGTSWTDVNNGLSEPIQSGKSVMSLAITGDNVFAGTSDCGVFLSNNNGNSWKASNNTLSDLHLYGKDVRALSINGSTIAAGTNGSGIFLSQDNGKSWTAVNNGLSDNGLYIWSLTFNGTSIFAGTSDGVFLSTDNGNKWNAVNNGFPDKDFIVRSIVANGNNVFAGTNGEGIFISSDNGSSWMSVDNGLTIPLDRPYSTNYSAKDVWSLGLSGSNIFAGTTAGVFLSIDNGSKWTSVSNGLGTSNGLYVRSIAIYGNHIIAGTGGGAFLSTNNGNSWTMVNHGCFNESPEVYSLAINNSYVFAGALGSVCVWRYSD